MVDWAFYTNHPKKGYEVMKKILAILFEALAIFGLLAGGYYLYQKYAQKNDNTEDLFEDDLDSFDFDDEDFTEIGSDTREYVTLNGTKGKQTSDDDFDEITD